MMESSGGGGGGGEKRREKGENTVHVASFHCPKRMLP